MILGGRHINIKIVQMLIVSL